MAPADQRMSENSTTLLKLDEGDKGMGGLKSFDRVRSFTEPFPACPSMFTGLIPGVAPVSVEDTLSPRH